MTRADTMDAVAQDADAEHSERVLRPYFHCRVAGLSAAACECLGSSALAALIEQWHLQTRANTTLRVEASALLYTAVARIDDRQTRNLLLRVRRDLFNGRPPRHSDLAASTSVLDDHERASVDTVVRGAEHAVLLIESIRETFARELSRTRRELAAMIQSEEFASGLLLSSRTLYQNIGRYSSAVAESRLNARDTHIERGLLRYFSRASMKATPFAKFCTVVQGDFRASSAPDARLHIVGPLSPQRSFVRLNKRLFALIWDQMRHWPVARMSLMVELAPTLRRRSDVLWFLTVLDGREVFQRLTCNAALDVVIDVLSPRSYVTLTELAARLMNDSRVDASSAEVLAYLDHLLTLGLLRFRTGIAEQELDWDGKLLAQLDDMEDPDARLTARALRVLRAEADRYASAGHVERRDISERIHGSVSDLLDRWTLPESALRGPAIYEDVTSDAHVLIDKNEAVDTAVHQLSSLVAALSPLFSPRQEQAGLRYFFEQYYSDRTAVPLLEFYEDFHREHLKAQLDLSSNTDDGRAVPSLKARSNPFDLPIVTSITEAHEALADYVRQMWCATPDDEEIVLSLDAIRRATARVGPPSRSAPSLAMFAQLIPGRQDTGTPCRLFLASAGLVLGHGKYFSRFLHMLPTECYERVFADTNAPSDEYRAEICGDSYFNANLHPALTQWVISYPTAETAVGDHQLSCNALSVVRAVDDSNALTLVHVPDGKRVVPLDLGFLSPARRPPLYQLLSKFSSFSAFNIRLPESLDASRAPDGSDASDSLSDVPDRVEHRPRITVEGTIVLARRRWRIPRSLFPIKHAREDDVGYFIRANAWRHEHGVPTQVYVRVIPLATKAIVATGDDGTDDTLPDQVVATPSDAGETFEVSDEILEGGLAFDVSEAKATSVKTPSHDYIKPQFIDFHSPLLVDLFGRIASTLPSFMVVIEERLPALDGLPLADGKPYVTELILQLDTQATDSSYACAP